MSVATGFASYLRQPLQREHGPRLSTHSAPILALTKLKLPPDLFQITLHFARGESAPGDDALHAHRPFDDQYRDDGGMPRHRLALLAWECITNAEKSTS